MSLEIFTTNVQNQQEADHLLRLLRQRISDGVIYFDLKDSKCVLRIETNREVSEVACSVVSMQGFNCKKII